MSLESNSSPTSPSQDVSDQVSSLHGNSHSASASGATGTGQSFFEKERTKLVAEIAEGLELLLSDSNSLNRKIEESISVGKEFEPIAALWGRFSEIMRVAGVDSSMVQEAENLSNNQSSNSNSNAINEEEEENQEGEGDFRASTGGATTPKSKNAHTTNPLNQSAKKSLSRSRNGNEQNETEILSKSQGGGEYQLPAGVAPGGGYVYGKD